MLRRLASGFFLDGDTLYKRNADMFLLRCVDEKEAQEILEEVHEGTFGTHANGHSLARKILRAGYYWTTMEADCCRHVRRCVKCSSNSLAKSDIVVAILDVRNRYDWTHRTQSFEWAPVHTSGH
ncbi:hypothetical protein CR513_53766, partial [Mucuna pruriens]